MSEENIEILLYNWFRKHNIPCFFNRKISKLQYCPSFKTKISQKKPDLIIYSKHKLINGFVAIEVKDATISRNVHNSNKILDYLKDYSNKKIKYFIDDKEIKIKCFAVATQNSLLGKLYTEKEIIYPGPEVWHKILQKTKQEPPYEFTITKNYLRLMWATWRCKREKNDPGLGIILSGILNKGYTNEPFLFCQMRYIKLNKIKKSWNVTWMKL